MDDLLTEFLTESSESIGVLDVELVRFEKSPGDPELLGSIFRLMHTIKGTCGFLGLPRLELVAHAAKNVLGKFRDGELVVDSDAVSPILESLDRIKDIMATLEATEVEPEGDDSELIDRLNAIADGKVSSVDADDTAPDADDTAPSDEPLGAMEELWNETAGPDDEAPADDEALAAAPTSSDEVLAASKQSEADETAAGEAASAGAAEPNSETDPESQPQSEPEPEPVAEAVAEAAPAAGPSAKPAERKPAAESNVAAQNIRVSVDLLENLMTTVSELVLSRNQLIQMVRDLDDNEFSGPLQRLSHITTDLQEGVMKTRMQPIGYAWSKLPRIVRDVGLDLGKQIDLEMQGEDTELDRQVLELIKDPLTHMVRNSGDHGIELPAERAAAGKPATGKILLNAYHEGGHINIQISDDGKGIDIDRVRDKITANGLATEAELAEMPKKQILQYVFQPGFSTAENVTSVSGRGVGMDVVKTNIEKIGGTVELESRAGRGTKFTIKIPLTLAIVSALIVESGGERFAIPQLSVIELVRTRADSEHSIEFVNGRPILRLRDRLLPLTSLSEKLGLDPIAAPEPAERIETVDPVETVDNDDALDTEDDSAVPEAAAQSEPPDTGKFIVVTQLGTYTFGIIVDRVFDTEEIVVKPVASILRDIAVFSGNTILGDGSVVMILDPNGVAATTGTLLHEAQSVASDDAAQTGTQKIAMLIFHAGDDEPKAVPLSLVARLEEIEREVIEMSGGQPMVQYRGALMPLVSVDGASSLVKEGRQQVIVFADGDQTMGLLVDAIMDIVEAELDVEIAAQQPGFLGTAVLSGKATSILDVAHFLDQVFGNWGNNPVPGSSSDGGAGRRLLLVDDSAFFRNLLSPVLSIAGYQVTTAENAENALKMREAGEGFDVIVSDIEMPGMSGFEFAEACRSDERWLGTPIVALSAKADPQKFEQGRETGIADYVSKSDRDALLSALEQTLTISGGAA